MISWRLPITTFSILAMIFLLVAVTSAMRFVPSIEPLDRAGSQSISRGGTAFYKRRSKLSSGD